ncbi:hypothetical protein CYD26_14785 [Pseudomonas sp. FFUP_PS_473]|nr:hypothetical protein CYD26_14785 [Pseudomonas sp. FFUP_PS_473]
MRHLGAGPFQCENDHSRLSASGADDLIFISSRQVVYVEVRFEGGMQWAGHGGAAPKAWKSLF